MPKPFKDYGDFCLISFAILGNYFALFGLPYARKARAALARGDAAQAERQARKARGWGLYGLLVSTPLNIALIWAICFYAWRAIKALAQHAPF